MHTVKELVDALNTFAPPQLAESWDHVGLMIGSKKQIVHKVLCALDVNLEVIDEAIRENAQLIVTHHPLLFKPIGSIDYETPMGAMIQKLIKHDIAVFSMHTNFDVVSGGINDYLADKIGLTQTRPLEVTRSENLQKLAIYVPKTHYEQVRETLIKFNTYAIGDYTGCTFSSEGTGTFMPMEGSKPYLGKTNQLEVVDEVKLECMIRSESLHTLIKEIKKVHPYEEVAYDVYNLEHIKHEEGIGRVGDCEPIEVEALIQKLKSIFNIPYVRLVAKGNKMISKIAICSGSGGSFIGIAAKKADLYITGDVSFHQAQEALSKGLVVIDVGHYASENIAMKLIESYLSKSFKAIQVSCSQINGETFQTL